MDHDGEGVPVQSERPEWFDLGSPPSINAVNGGGGNDHVGAHAWWTDLPDLTRGFQRRTLTLSAYSNSSKVNTKSKSNFSW